MNYFLKLSFLDLKFLIYSSNSSPSNLTLLLTTKSITLFVPLSMRSRAKVPGAVLKNSYKLLKNIKILERIY